MKAPLFFVFHFVRINLEAIIWLAAIVVLAFGSLPDGKEHLSLCPFHNLGLSFCPGCGLGRSITLLFHGYLKASFDMHPLGIPAVIILLWRSFSIFRKNYPLIKLYNNGTKSLPITSGTGR